MPFSKFYRLKPGSPNIITPFYDKDFYEFTNFSHHPIEDPAIPGIIFPTSEHYFQAMKIYQNPKYKKSQKDAYLNAILKCSTAAQALEIARKWTRGKNPVGILKWDTPDIQEWENRKEKVMSRALDLKLAQHPEIGNLLVSTQDTCLVEDTAKRVVLDGEEEDIWGWGSTGQGTNLLGIALMKKRNELHKKEGNSQWVLEHPGRTPEALYRSVQQERRDLTSEIDSKRKAESQKLRSSGMTTLDAEAESMGLKYCAFETNLPGHALSLPSFADMKSRIDRLHAADSGMRAHGSSDSAGPSPSAHPFSAGHPSAATRHPAVRVTGITTEDFQKFSGDLKKRFEKENTSGLSISSLTTDTFAIARVANVPITSAVEEFKKIQEKIIKAYEAGSAKEDEQNVKKVEKIVQNFKEHEAESARIRAENQRIDKENADAQKLFDKQSQVFERKKEAFKSLHSDEKSGHFVGEGDKAIFFTLRDEEHIIKIQKSLAEKQNLSVSQPYPYNGTNVGRVPHLSPAELEAEMHEIVLMQRMVAALRERKLKAAEEALIIINNTMNEIEEKIRLNTNSLAVPGLKTKNSNEFDRLTKENGDLSDELGKLKKLKTMWELHRKENKEQKVEVYFKDLRTADLLSYIQEFHRLTDSADVVNVKGPTPPSPVTLKTKKKEPPPINNLELEFAEMVLDINISRKFFSYAQIEEKELLAMDMKGKTEAENIQKKLKEALGKIDEARLIASNAIEKCKEEGGFTKENIQDAKVKLANLKNAQKNYEELASNFKTLVTTKSVKRSLVDIAYKSQEKRVDVRFVDDSPKPEEVQAVVENLKSLTENNTKAEVTIYGCQDNRELAQNLAIQAMIQMKRAPRFHATTTAEFFKENPKELQQFCIECKKAIDTRLKEPPLLSEPEKAELQQVYNEMLSKNRVEELLQGAAIEKFPETGKPAASTALDDSDAPLVVKRSSPSGKAPRSS